MVGRLDSRFVFARPALSWLVLFSGVQVLDAVLTWRGIARYGSAVEANPILAFYAGLIGPAAALGFAKAVAVFGGWVLYRRSHDVALAVLTLVYMFGAVMPWLWLFGTS